MAHAVVEWTDNLATEVDIRELLQLIAADMRDSGIFPWGGIRVRGVRLTDYVVADDAADYAFVNIVVTLGAGRDPLVKKAFFDALFGRVKEHFAPLHARRLLALSMYVNEADEAGSYKHNNLHARFKART